MIEDKLREMLEAQTIADLQQAHWQLQGMIQAGAKGDPEAAKRLYHMRLDELAPAIDLGNLHPVFQGIFKPFNL